MAERRSTPMWQHLLFVAICGLCALSPAQAKSYHFTRTEITAAIALNGTMHVQEARDYAFAGSFHHAQAVIPLPEGTTLSDFAVSEPGVAYRRRDGDTAGSYRLSTTEGQVTADWYYGATDETRTFLIDYDVTGAVVKHADLAELYWKFVSSDVEVASDKARVTVMLPGRIPKEDIRAWAHGPLWGSVTRAESRVDLVCDPLPASSMLEGRLLFPASALAASPRTDDRTVLAEVLAEEEKLAEEANRTRTSTQRDLKYVVLFLLGVPVALTLPGALIWLFLYLRFGREYRSQNLPHYLPEPPFDWTPGQVGWLWRWGYLGMNTLNASVMDLVRRGALQITAVGGTVGHEEYALTRVSGFAQPLSVPDRYLIDELLFGSFREATALSLKEFGEESQRHPAVSQQRFREWRRLTRAECQSFVLDDPASRTASYVGLAIGLLMVPLALPAMVLSPLSLLTAFVGIFLAIASRVIRRRTREAAGALHRWQAFRRYLLDFSQLKDYPAPAVVLWEKYLVYAIVLDVSERVMRQLRQLAPQVVTETSDTLAFSSWLTSPGGASPLGRVEAVTQAMSSVSEALAVAHSQPSSSSGGSGGFSGGSSGGGGGGGGGGSRSAD